MAKELIEIEITEQDIHNLQDTLHYIDMTETTLYDKRLYERLRETYQKIYDSWIANL